MALDKALIDSSCDGSPGGVFNPREPSPASQGGLGHQSPGHHHLRPLPRNRPLLPGPSLLPPPRPSHQSPRPALPHPHLARRAAPYSLPNLLEDQQEYRLRTFEVRLSTGPVIV